MFRTISIIALAAAVAGVAFHFLAFNRRRVQAAWGARTVLRFSIWERLAHGLLAIAFVCAAVTGFVPVILWKSGVEGWFRVVHTVSGLISVVFLAVVMFLWARDSVFEPHDGPWFRRLGGYLGGRDAPAGRFNACQKLFFWCAVTLGFVTLVSGLAAIYPVFPAGPQAVMFEVHRYAALFFVMMVIGHIYLGTIATRGTWQGMVSGRVSAEWIAQHHPLWPQEDADTADLEP